MQKETININGPIQILVIYQDSGVRDINQESKGLGMVFYVDYCNTIHKIIQDMMHAGYNVETTFQV